MGALAAQPLTAVDVAAGGLGRRRLLSGQVQSHADQAGALLERIGGRAFQVETDIQWRARRAVALHPLGAELLPDGGLPVEDERQLAENPDFVRFRVQAVLAHREGPAGGPEHLVQAANTLFARDVLEVYSPALVAEGRVEWCRELLIHVVQHRGTGPARVFRLRDHGCGSQRRQAASPLRLLLRLRRHCLLRNLAPGGPPPVYRTSVLFYSITPAAARSNGCTAQGK